MTRHVNLDNPDAVKAYIASKNTWSNAVAKDIKKARELIEAGFEYVTEMEGMKIFKRRK